jgi:hypothetical protein
MMPSYNHNSTLYNLCDVVMELYFNAVELSCFSSCLHAADLQDKDVVRYRALLMLPYCDT